MRQYLDQCPCGSGKEAEALFDGYGIFLTYACDKCKKKKLSHFRPDIMERYDCDEPIDGDEPSDDWLPNESGFSIYPVKGK